MEENASQLKIRLLPGSGSKPVARWVLWLRYGNQWYVEIHRNSRLLVNMDRLTAIAAAAVDHVGNESPRSAWVVN